MIKRKIRRLINRLSFEVRRTEVLSNKEQRHVARPPPVDPIWPLPRRSGMSDEEVRNEFSKHELWHYPFQFEGGLSFTARHNDPGPLSNAIERPLQRFKHFMPYLVQSQNGSLKGKRILDIACNAGFWSIQCALRGADVVGFDARDDLIRQANLIKSIVGISNVEFRVLDFWDMSPRSLDGSFDVVLNLGILYHLANPLEALELTKSLAKSVILLDTGVAPTNQAILRLRWEEPDDIRRAHKAGIVAFPSRSAIDLMLRHIGAAEWYEIPIRALRDMPEDYVNGSRASWLITV